jgi:Fe-coproporphyrin III synthase
VPLLHEVRSEAGSGLASGLTSMPILILNVHTNCNSRCIMCDIWKRETHEQVRVADLDRHRASLRNLGVRQVVLSGGEPLLHNDLAALCEFFLEQNIRLTLLTTGLLLLKRAREVSALFDEVIVSIDGPQEIHDGIRRVKGAFDLIGQGVAAVRAHRPDIRISCRTTVQKANHRHLGATVAAARTLRFDSISFLAADLTSEAFNRPLVWPGERQSEIALTVSEVAALHEDIERLIVEHAYDIRDRFIAESPAKLRRIARRFREHLGQVAPESPVCNAPWVSAVVEVDGSVRPCFFHRPVGNVTASTLEEVVNGEAAQGFRKSLNVAENPTCRRCVCSLNYHQE